MQVPTRTAERTAEQEHADVIAWREQHKGDGSNPTYTATMLHARLGIVRGEHVGAAEKAKP
jgi:hypothetical protein